jgi:hypothetical protein
MTPNEREIKIEQRKAKIRELEKWIADLKFLLSEITRINSSMPALIPGYDRLK